MINNEIDETREVGQESADGSSINWQDIAGLCISKWYWFAISVVICLFFALAYLLRTSSVYTRSASVEIKDTKGGSSNMMSDVFSDMGLFNTTNNVNNEVIAFQSPALMLDVVKRLHLDVTYQQSGTFHRKLLYGKDLPVSVNFLNIIDNVGGSFEMVVNNNNVTLSDFQVDENEIAGGPIKFQLNDTVDSPLGKLTVKATPYFVSASTKEPIYVTRTGLYLTTDNYGNRLEVSLANKQATVINLSFSDISTQRAEEVLNTIINVYNENWIKDKNQIAVSTSNFINDRLGVIEQELGHVDSDISSFKTENMLPDAAAVTNIELQRSTEANKLTMEYNNQLSVARYIRNYIAGASATSGQLLPANSGIENTNVESLITQYNTLQLQRNSLVENSSEQNPLVQDYDQQLRSLKSSILNTIDNLIVSLNTRVRSSQASQSAANARIAANPMQAKYLLSVERQQKVKEELYLYLLQKREENELSQAFTAYNTRIVTPPTGSLYPTAPKRNVILLSAILLGFCIPLALIILKELLNVTVRGRKDIEKLTIPYIGEIPQAFEIKRTFLERLGLKRTSLEDEGKDYHKAIVVKDKSRDVINEAFRVVRANLEFMLGKDTDNKIIMSTSMNSGSGKTFLTMNMAVSLGIKGKRVIIVDLDLRQASISRYVDSPHHGVSDYLGGVVDEYNSLIVKGKVHEMVDMLPVGVLPPNPAELLYSDRLQTMLNELRQAYDYVFIDCPPVEIVADAAIINESADMTMFAIRAGLMIRDMLPEVQKFYNSKKYKNMALILNGTENSYGKHYGYRYGYSYGYGHYGSYHQKEKK